MADATTPNGAVEQVVPDAASLEGILEQSFGDKPAATRQRAQSEPEQQPEQEAAAETDSDELTPEDLADDDAPATEPAAGDEFEIVHNGQTQKLSRAETIKLAQQGFDYTQKTQRVAEQQKQAESVLKRAAEVEQMTPYVVQELATVKAYEAQLNQYANVDWVRLATDDPLEYPQHRARYDQLMQGYQRANGQLQNVVGNITQARQQLIAQKLQHESAALVERIPAWRDPDKYRAGAQEVTQWLVSQGADPQEVANLTDSLAVAVAHKAMLYDKLVKAKADRTKQVRAAPPVVRPGANAPSDAGKTLFTKARNALKTAGRQGNTRTQEQIMEGLLNKTFKLK